MKHPNKINMLLTKEEEMKENVITELERSRFCDVLTSRKDPDPVIMLECRSICNARRFGLLNLETTSVKNDF